MSQRKDKKEPPSLGKLLRALRKQHRYSLEGLGEASGISKNHIWRIEQGYDPKTGKPLKPHPNVLMLLGRVLGDSYDALMQAAGYLPDEIASVVVEEKAATVPMPVPISIRNPRVAVMLDWVPGLTEEEWASLEQARADSAERTRQERQEVRNRRQHM